MAINELLILAFSCAAGMVLGAIFFGGLWWTVRGIVVSKLPVVWVVVSLLLRVSIVVTGFYFVGRDQWQRLLLCLLGFVVARVIVTRLTRLPDIRATPAAQEASRAS
jgi:F1F0 ATPase subunit 2